MIITSPRHPLLLSLLLVVTLAACSKNTRPAALPPVETPPAPAQRDSTTPTTRAPITLPLASAAVHDATRQARARALAAPTPMADPFSLLDASKQARGSRDLVLVAVGDVSQPTKQWPEATNSLKTKAFAPTQHLLDSGDLVFMNLENPVSELSPTAKKTYSFTAHPDRLGWYFDVGFNLFSLSNNHIADADQQGIDDTLMHLQNTQKERDVAAWWAGAGTSPEEAERPVIFSPPGKDLKIAFFSTGFSKSPNVSKFWSESLLRRIKEVDSQVDLVIVSVHAGKEYQHVPEADIQKRFHEWIDAGVDLVIGHHPHVIRPVETYNHGLILYSLGNYVFASRTVRHRKSHARMYGLLTRVVIQDGKVTAAEITPTWVNNSEDWVLPGGERLKNSNFVPQVLTGPFADAFFEDFNQWTEEAGATPPERVGDVGRYTVTPALDAPQVRR